MGISIRPVGVIAIRDDSHVYHLFATEQLRRLAASFRFPCASGRTPPDKGAQRAGRPGRCCYRGGGVTSVIRNPAGWMAPEANG